MPFLIAIYAAFPIIALCWLGSRYGVVIRVRVSENTWWRTGFAIKYSVIGLGVTVACACIDCGVRAVRY